MTEKKHKILIIDDEEDIIGLLTLHLKMKNYEVTSATDGVMGLEVADQEDPDIILLDVMMPGIDGFEVCKRLKEKEKTAEIPIIFLTARNQTDDRVKGLMSGADDYIVKPFDFDELELRVRRSLKNFTKKQEVTDLLMVDFESMKEKLVKWYDTNLHFDLFYIRLANENESISEMDIQKDFTGTLLVTLRELKPTAYLLVKIATNYFFLFVATMDLETFAKYLIDNFKKNTSYNAHLKMKIRPDVTSNYPTLSQLVDKLKSEI